MASVRPATSPCIALEGVGVSYAARGATVQAIADVTLDVAEGEFIALLGPTGCGKSTLLRVVSDLLAPSQGSVSIRGGSTADARRANDFGFVFQEAALLPWRTALDNVNLPLEVVGYPAAERLARCRELLQSVGLSKFEQHYPHELSGGMKQRVAIVRALAWNPSILLMDEPFSALDELTKNQLQDDLLEIWNRERKTVLFVTHNISEAVYLADRVVVMSAHPGGIKRVIDVDLPRPRTPGMRETLAFIEQVRLAREALQAEHRTPS
ncbi:MAG: ABC transporter ATP-binding protein [Pigmentiphaga sp.]|uniref:ABC transporter ATP-binding protein n=1 Tax=Pigmentiphaga sp. TaxID=1977564 RepID=UPI0029B3FDFA|nr:ABC transporter ATP-binding protein [Pigmentiphaga sp.]MDX3905999.1 ABC transporter ATP-binding protein [Pigmentiphaga sp.]